MLYCISELSDVDTFLMELSGFLREYGKCYSLFACLSNNSRLPGLLRLVAQHLVTKLLQLDCRHVTFMNIVYLQCVANMISE